MTGGSFWSNTLMLTVVVADMKPESTTRTVSVYRDWIWLSSDPATNSWPVVPFSLKCPAELPPMIANSCESPASTSDTASTAPTSVSTGTFSRTERSCTSGVVGASLTSTSDTVTRPDAEAPALSVALICTVSSGVDSKSSGAGAA